MKIDIKIEAKGPVINDPMGAQTQIWRSVTGAISEGTVIMAGEVSRDAPIGASAKLSQGILASGHNVSIAADRVIGRVFPTVPYGQYVDQGTRPHMPPLEPILHWVERVLGGSVKTALRKKHPDRIQGGRKSAEQDSIRKTAQAIRFSIYKHGTSRYSLRTRGSMGYQMFARGFRRGEPKVMNHILTSVKLVIQRLGGRG